MPSLFFFLPHLLFFARPSLLPLTPLTAPVVSPAYIRLPPSLAGLAGLLLSPALCVGRLARAHCKTRTRCTCSLSYASQRVWSHSHRGSLKQSIAVLALATGRDLGAPGIFWRYRPRSPVFIYIVQVCGSSTSQTQLKRVRQRGRTMSTCSQGPSFNSQSSPAERAVVSRCDAGSGSLLPCQPCCRHRCRYRCGHPACRRTLDNRLNTHPVAMSVCGDILSRNAEAWKKAANIFGLPRHAHLEHPLPGGGAWVPSSAGAH